MTSFLSQGKSSCRQVISIDWITARKDSTIVIVVSFLSRRVRITSLAVICVRTCVFVLRTQESAKGRPASKRWMMMAIYPSNWICSLLVDRKNRLNRTEQRLFFFALEVDWMFLPLSLSRVQKTDRYAHAPRVDGIGDGEVPPSASCEYTHGSSSPCEEDTTRKRGEERRGRETKEKEKEEKAMHSPIVVVIYIYARIVTDRGQSNSNKNSIFFFFFSFLATRKWDQWCLVLEQEEEDEEKRSMSRT